MITVDAKQFIVGGERRGFGNAVTIHIPESEQLPLSGGVMLRMDVKAAILLREQLDDAIQFVE